MTPEERVKKLGCVFETHVGPDDGDEQVEVWRSEIATAIAEAVAEERERCAKVAESFALVGGGVVCLGVANKIRQG